MVFGGLGVLVYGDIPEFGQIGLQDAASPIMEKVIILHDGIMLIVLGIVSFVLWLIIGAIIGKILIYSTINQGYYELLGGWEIMGKPGFKRIYVIYQFIKKGGFYFMEWRLERERNVYSPYFIDWSWVEILWTILPAVILVFIAFPSLQLLYIMDEVSDPALTIKVVGHQWYWSYEYSDYGPGLIEYDSYMIPTEDIQLGELRLLEVDNRLVVPINMQVRVLVTGADVLHSFAVPSLGIKIDAVPGRLNQTNFILKRPGVFYGQCSEICGANHSFMPIVVEGVSLDKYFEWVNAQVPQGKGLFEGIR